MFCVNCGKEIKENFKFCAYCGTKAVDFNSDDSSQENETNLKNNGNWPVAIFKEESFRKDRYFAYDIATESETDFCDSIEEVKSKIIDDIEKWKHTVEEVPTEQQIKKNDYIQKLIDDEYKLIEILYLNIELEND